MEREENTALEIKDTKTCCMKCREAEQELQAPQVPKPPQGSLMTMIPSAWHKNPVSRF